MRFRSFFFGLLGTVGVLPFLGCAAVSATPKARAILQSQVLSSDTPPVSYLQTSPTGTGTNSGTGTGTSNGAQTGTQTGSDTGTGTGAQTGTQTGTATGHETGTQTGTATGSETGSQTGTGSGGDVTVIRECGKLNRTYLEDIQKTTTPVAFFYAAVKVDPLDRTSNAIAPLGSVPLPRTTLPKGYKISVPATVITALNDAGASFPSGLVIRVCAPKADGSSPLSHPYQSTSSQCVGLNADVDLPPNVNGPAVEIFTHKLAVGETVSENGDPRNPECDVENGSPLVLDLDGRGIRLSGPETSGVRFDLRADGTLPQVGWVTSARTPLLALDLNDNGKIDSGRELFGNATLVGDRPAANGFDALRQYDSNGDRKITSDDAAWQSLVLWEDGNINGKTDLGELVPLGAEGIKEIDLDYVQMFEQDRFLNETRQRSTFERTSSDGNSLITSLIVDIWFSIK